MLLLAAATFIGSQACAPCHAAIAKAYSQTAMARSSGRVESVPPATFKAAGQAYRIADNHLIFDKGSISMNYFIGSNAKGRSYVFKREGYLFELPVTWYSQKQKWDASPGYEHATEVVLNRPVEASCLRCHASRVRPVVGSQNRYGDPPFLDDGVSCERCHGPGSDHVRNPVSAPMVNPAKLEPDRRDSICSQCHLTGEARVEYPGRRFADYRAGERLSDYVTYMVWNAERGDLKVTSHVEKLTASGCKRASGDALWCGTCHDPHTNQDKTQAACLNCHAAAHHAQEQCATCHMPKSPVVDGGHGVLTDHSIPRVAKQLSPPKRSDLKAFLGIAGDREKGLAYAELRDPRARAYLLKAVPGDTPVLLRLASLEQDPIPASALYELVLKADPNETSALVNLGVLYAQAGRNEDAAKLWERALVTNPAIEEAVLNLAQIRPSTEARSILFKYLAFNPASTAATARLKAFK